MVRRRIPLVACAVGALWLGACSSDTPSNSSANSADTSTTVGASRAVTTTTAPVSAVTAAAATTTIAGTASSSGTTATTVKSRVVTSPSDSVKLGDTGTGVEQIQTALKQAGYKVTVDGQFGPQTDTAVRAFQKKNGLTVDGVVGPKTWAKLSGGSSSGSTASTAAPTSTTTG